MHACVYIALTWLMRCGKTVEEEHMRARSVKENLNIYTVEKGDPRCVLHAGSKQTQMNRKGSHWLVAAYEPMQIGGRRGAQCSVGKSNGILDMCVVKEKIHMQDDSVVGNSN